MPTLLVSTADSGTVRQLLDQMSADEKRLLVEAMLGASLADLFEPFANAHASDGSAPAVRAHCQCQAPLPSLPAAPLRRRECEITELVACGLSNREIAETLVVSVRTVVAHVTHVLAKLGLRSRAQIAVWAAKHAEQLGSSARSPSPGIRELPVTPAPWRTRSLWTA